MEHIPFCSVHGGNLCSTDWPFWLLGDLGERTPWRPWESSGFRYKKWGSQNTTGWWFNGGVMVV